MALELYKQQIGRLCCLGNLITLYITLHKTWPLDYICQCVGVSAIKSHRLFANIHSLISNSLQIQTRMQLVSLIKYKKKSYQAAIKVYKIYLNLFFCCILKCYKNI